MTVLPQLESELLEAHARLARRNRLVRAWLARRESTTGARTRGRVSHRRTWLGRSLGAVPVVLAVAATLVVVFVAVTAIGHRQPASQGPAGLVAPGTAKLVAQGADPRGGLPWGLRTFQATRGQTCLQVGRVQSGTIGVIGQDNSFSNDGRFHPISPEAFHAEHGDYCTGVDARGHAFQNIFVREAPASAGFGSAHGECRVGPPPRRTPPCPSKDLRNLAYGLLGPDAVGITYVSPGGQRITTRTGGSDGAYLLVLPATTQSCGVVPGGGRRCLGGAGEISTAPLTSVSGVISAVTYRDGHVCQLARPTSARAGTCPRVGYAAPTPFHASTVPAAQVATPVTGRARPAKYYCFRLHTRSTAATVPCNTRTPRGYGRDSGQSDGLLIEISFTARLAANNSHSVYEFAMSDPSDPGCPGSGGGVSGTTMTPIHSGQHIKIQDFESGCPGRYTGLVTYQPNGYPGRDTLSTNGPIHDGSTLVGRFNFVLSCHGKQSCRGSS